MKKSIIPVAAFIAGMAIVPSVFAAKKTELTFGAVSDYTSCDTLLNSTSCASGKLGLGSGVAKVTGDLGYSNVTVTYSGTMELKYVEQDERGEKAAWLGVKVIEPTAGFTANDDRADVQIITDGGEPEAATYSDSETSGGFYSLYAPLTIERLTEEASKGNKVFTLRTWGIDWDGDDVADQTITMNVDLSDITLYQINDEGEVDLKAEAFTPTDAEELLAAAPEAPADDSEENNDEGETNPNTADSIATYLTIATVALLGLGATAFVAKKSNR